MKSKLSKDAINYNGERTFQTYEAWKRACKQIDPNVKFDGDKDICQAGKIGEWDGDKGVIYNTKDSKTKDEAIRPEIKKRLEQIFYNTPYNKNYQDWYRRFTPKARSTGATPEEIQEFLSDSSLNLDSKKLMKDAASVALKKLDRIKKRMKDVELSSRAVWNRKDFDEMVKAGHFTIVSKQPYGYEVKTKSGELYGVEVKDSKIKDDDKSLIREYKGWKIYVSTDSGVYTVVKGAKFFNFNGGANHNDNVFKIQRIIDNQTKDAFPVGAKVKYVGKYADPALTNAKAVIIGAGNDKGVGGNMVRIRFDNGREAIVPYMDVEHTNDSKTKDNFYAISDIKYRFLNGQITEEQALMEITKNQNRRNSYGMEPSGPQYLKQWKIEKGTKDSDYDLGSGHLGNGITVWNRKQQEHGDYKKIAHIGPDRKITWLISNPPSEVKNYVEGIANGPNSGVSTSQPYLKVFNDSKIKDNKSDWQVKYIASGYGTLSDWSDNKNNAIKEFNRVKFLSKEQIGEEMGLNDDLIPRISEIRLVDDKGSTVQSYRVRDSKPTAKDRMLKGLDLLKRRVKDAFGMNTEEQQKEFDTRNIEEETIKNNAFRRVVFTGNTLQLVLMSLLPNEDIGMEVHNNVDQFFRIEEGEGLLEIEGQGSQPVKDGFSILITAGTKHNVKNIGSEPLKLYTIYGPPNHPADRLQNTKAEAVKEEEESKKVIGDRKTKDYVSSSDMYSAGFKLVKSEINGEGVEMDWFIHPKIKDHHFLLRDDKEGILIGQGSSPGGGIITTVSTPMAVFNFLKNYI